MNNSNWTGRFDRVSSNRWIPFEDDHPAGPIAGLVVALVVVFLAVVALFGAV